MDNAIIQAVINSWSGRLICRSELAEIARKHGAEFNESWEIADEVTFILSEEIDKFLN